MDDFKSAQKRGLSKRAWILIALAVAYCISFFLPIFVGQETRGYDGARFAFEVLQEGLEFFIPGTVKHSAWTVSYPIAQALPQIFLGSVNILFVFGFIFLIVRHSLSYGLASSCAVNMVYWGLGDWDKPLNIGYYLWAGCGLALLVLSAREYVVKKKMRYGELFYRPVSLSLYLPIVFLVLTRLLSAR